MQELDSELLQEVCSYVRAFDNKLKRNEAMKATFSVLMKGMQARTEAAMNDVRSMTHREIPPEDTAKLERMDREYVATQEAILSAAKLRTKTLREWLEKLS